MVQKLLVMKCLLAVWLCCVVLVKDAKGNRTCDMKPVFRSEGDLRLAVLVNECSSSALSKTVMLTAAWLAERINFLGVFGSAKLGVDIYNVCDERDLFDPVVNVAKEDAHSLGIITWIPVPPKIRALSNVLDVPIIDIFKQWRPQLAASVVLMTTMNWNENVTLVTNDPEVLQLFYHESRKDWICVKSLKDFSDSRDINYNNPVIMFGSAGEITSSLINITFDEPKLLVVPLDSSQVEGLPDGSFIIQPTFADLHHSLSKLPRILPSPIMLDLAVPLYNIAKDISEVITQQCNLEKEQVKCLKKVLSHVPKSSIDIDNRWEILNFLKIEELADTFYYNIFKVENIDLLAQKTENSTESNETDSEADITMIQSYLKVGKYNLFNYTLFIDTNYLGEENNSTNDTAQDICTNNHRICHYECLNFKPELEDTPEENFLEYNIILKQEPWVLAVLSIASLGVIFCLAILIFIFVRLCKKDIFEGNPVLSVLLLLTLTVMYASVVPFTLEITTDSEFSSTLGDYLCLIRSLTVTLTYSCAFSLMFSRCVMLATVSYETSFMSHITGHVQSLLCLFMVAVQGALSLQSVENCQDVFAGFSFLYILSYDILLLGLLLCSCPFIYRSQRNYKEGGYFTIAIILMVLFWVAWLTTFSLVEERWRVIVVCAGLLGTASAILGAVFIPRTYLMTGAVVRDSITSALPSLAFASSSSVLDLNYSNAQHVYDCVNIAAVSTNMVQNIPPPVPQTNPNFYSEEPGLETTERSTNSPPCDSPDKVTRF